jgi:hypothetical protein
LFETEKLTSPTFWRIRVQKLKEYRKTLLLAHKKAVSDKQEVELPPSPASPLDMHSVGYTTSVYSFGNASDSSTKLPPKFSGESASNEPVRFQTSLVQNMSKELPTRSEQENDDSFLPSVWTCSTCVGTKFSCKCTCLSAESYQYLTRTLPEPYQNLESVQL